MFRAALLCSCVLALSFPAYAEEKKVDVPADNPHLARAQEKAVEIAKTFNEQEINDLAMIKDGFGIIHSVRVTSRSVAAAVKECVKNNPEMKADMGDQYKAWEASVSSVLKGKEKEMYAAVSDGRFSKPKEVKEFLGMIDEAAQYADSKIDKKPLGTPSACEGLMKSMKDSEKTLGEMLQALAFPRSNAPLSDQKPADSQPEPKE